MRQQVGRSKAGCGERKELKVCTKLVANAIFLQGAYSKKLSSAQYRCARMEGG